MKNCGSIFEYEQERNADLMRAYREAIGECSHIRLSDMMRRVVNKPSRRFWVSEERAAIVMSNMARGDTLDNMRPLKREMYQEIYRRVMERKAERPDDSLYQLTFDVVRQPAPKFFLTPASAEVIICKIKKRWYERRKKTRHTY